MSAMLFVCVQISKSSEIFGFCIYFWSKNSRHYLLHLTSDYTSKCVSISGVRRPNNLTAGGENWWRLFCSSIFRTFCAPLAVGARKTNFIKFFCLFLFQLKNGTGRTRGEHCAAWQHIQQGYNYDYAKLKKKYCFLLNIFPLYNHTLDID